MITQPQKNKIFLETYGCQMNEYDSELVRSILAKGEYAFTKDELEADVVMLNTCAIRENAHRKVYGRIHEIRHKRSQIHKVTGAQGQKPVVIGILGCMATNLRQELLENESLDIDFIAGPDSYKRLPQLIEEAVSGKKAFDVTLSEFETYSDVFPVRKGGPNAWIAIMRGCDNFCTFCVVPYTRGRERSRSIENIVAETRQLAADGARQITLLGQNVNSYKHEGADFADLLQAVSEVDGIKRIRFTSPHPKDFPRKVLNVIAKNPKICKMIHLPLQSGNDRILEKMNRTYTQKEFLNLVKEIRSVIPNISFSTDIIVGFPTETREEFEDTLKVVQEVEFDSAFLFKYSERKNTIASKKFPDDVTEEEKTERIVRLQEIQRDITLKKNSAHIGTIQTILIEEGTGRYKPSFVGRADGNQLVLLNPEDRFEVGELVQVKITAASPHSLKGTPILKTLDAGKISNV